MKRKMSAKDKAFQDERMRLMGKIEEYRQLVITRDAQLYARDKKIEELEKTNKFLEEKIQEHFNMTPAEFVEHINRDMRGIEAIEFLKAMTSRLGGMY